MLALEVGRSDIYILQQSNCQPHCLAILQCLMPHRLQTNLCWPAVRHSSHLPQISALLTCSFADLDELYKSPLFAQSRCACRALHGHCPQTMLPRERTLAAKLGTAQALAQEERCLLILHAATSHRYRNHPLQRLSYACGPLRAILDASCGPSTSCQICFK